MNLIERLHKEVDSLRIALAKAANERDELAAQMAAAKRNEE